MTLYCTSVYRWSNRVSKARPKAFHSTYRKKNHIKNGFIPSNSQYWNAWCSGTHACWTRLSLLHPCMLRTVHKNTVTSDPSVFITQRPGGCISAAFHPGFFKPMLFVLWRGSYFSASRRAFDCRPLERNTKTHPFFMVLPTHGLTRPTFRLRETVGSDTERKRGVERWMDWETDLWRCRMMASPLISQTTGAGCHSSVLERGTLPWNPLHRTIQICHYLIWYLWCLTIYCIWLHRTWLIFTILHCVNALNHFSIITVALTFDL